MVQNLIQKHHAELKLNDLLKIIEKLGLKEDIFPKLKDWMTKMVLPNRQIFGADETEEPIKDQDLRAPMHIVSVQNNHKSCGKGDRKSNRGSCTICNISSHVGLDIQTQTEGESCLSIPSRAL